MIVSERFRLRLIHYRVFIWAALGILFVGLAGFFVFAAAVPRVAEPPSRTTDAIVVLTGGSERLTTGLELLHGGWAQKMLVSGVSSAVDVNTLLAAVKRDANDFSDQIDIGHSARDTFGNAKEATEWMGNNGFESLRLITAGYHMLRSRKEFEHAMPKVEVVPHPVFPASVHLDQWWLWPGTTALLINEYVKFLATCLRSAIEPRGNHGK